MATVAPLVQTPLSTDSPTTDAPARQYGLDVLRVLAICCVVAIHIFGDMTEIRDLRGSGQWWAALVVYLGGKWAVPVFVMISGALVLHPRAHAAGPAAFYRKRFARIIPAMVVWHLVYVLLVRKVLQREDMSMATIGRALIDARFYTALDFLWLIAGLYLIAPVLAAFLRDGGPRRANIIAAVALSWTLVAFMIPGVSQLLGIPRTNYLGSLNQWWPYVGYFLAGWALRNVTLRWRGAILATIVAGAAFAEMIWQAGTSPQSEALWALSRIHYFGLVVAILSICIFLLGTSLGRHVTLPRRVARFLVVLSDASFGVYLVHLLIFEFVELGVPIVEQGRSIKALLAAYAIVLPASFLISIVASRIRYLRAIF